MTARDFGEKKKTHSTVVTLSDTTRFKGVLKFKETLCIRGKFTGTVLADDGDLIVDKGAVVEAEAIKISNLTVHGTVSAPIHAKNSVDLCAGAQVCGDITTERLRIADGVLFEGQCSMVDADKNIEIFSRPSAEIRAELRHR